MIGYSEGEGCLPCVWLRVPCIVSVQHIAHKRCCNAHQAPNIKGYTVRSPQGKTNGPPPLLVGDQIVFCKRRLQRLRKPFPCVVEVLMVNNAKTQTSLSSPNSRKLVHFERIELKRQRSTGPQNRSAFLETLSTANFQHCNTNLSMG